MKPAISIRKIRLINFKKFVDYTILPNEKVNILVGDNEAGKSSVLEAISLVASGSIKRIENVGFDKLINASSVKKFNAGKRIFENLPKMKIELYLDGEFDHTMNGKNNEDKTVCDGIRLVCEPDIDFQNEVSEALSQKNYFPFEYYRFRFSTFADETYSGFRRKLNVAMIDSSKMNAEIATNEFICGMYEKYTSDTIAERTHYKSEYRRLRETFMHDTFNQLNSRIPQEKGYAFGLKNGASMRIENDLMIYEDAIPIDSKGMGMQVFIKTNFALEKTGSKTNIVLFEEPENHLSHTNLRKLVSKIASANNCQVFITTHNSMISTRLELRNVLLMHLGNETKPATLRDLTEDTSKYFLKAPVAGIIEFALSEKVILVEGPSEYMMMDKFYMMLKRHSPENDGVHIIDIRGLSFKRYLEVAKITGASVAVITDNDGDPYKNCVEKYVAFSDSNKIKIFYNEDSEKTTYEVVLFHDNQKLCEKLFGTNTLNFMLNNKTESAYKILASSERINVPQYIQEAINWISA